jgi:hypothetical protein
MSDGDDEYEDMIELLSAEDASAYHPVFEDAVAERTYAFSLLMRTTSEIEEETVRELGVNMMQAIIRSIGGTGQNITAVVRK